LVAREKEDAVQVNSEIRQRSSFAMRHIGLLLVSLLSSGCGTGAGNHDPLSLSSTFAPPSITTLTPESVPVNSVPFTITVNGSNFGTDALVFWNGTPQFTIFVTPNQLMANVTDTDLSFAGLVPIYVRTGGLNSNTVNFNVAVQ
jgi:IPT/TIG domain